MIYINFLTKKLASPKKVSIIPYLPILVTSLQWPQLDHCEDSHRKWENTPVTQTTDNGAKTILACDHTLSLILLQ